MYKKIILAGKEVKENGESYIFSKTRKKKINDLLEYCNQKITSKIVVTENTSNVTDYLQKGNNAYLYIERGTINQTIQFTKLDLDYLKEEIEKETKYKEYLNFMNNLVISKIKNKEIAINKYKELLEKLENTNFFNTIDLNNHIDEIREYNITSVIYKGKKCLFFLFQHTNENPDFVARLQNKQNNERFLVSDIENIEFLHDFY